MEPKGSLSWATWIQFKPSNPISLKSILIVLFHQRLSPEWSILFTTSKQILVCISNVYYIPHPLCLLDFIFLTLIHLLKNKVGLLFYNFNNFNNRYPEDDCLLGYCTVDIDRRSRVTGTITLITKTVRSTETSVNYQTSWWYLPRDIIIATEAKLQQIICLAILELSSLWTNP